MASAGENRRLNPTMSIGGASSRRYTVAIRSRLVPGQRERLLDDTCLPASSERTT